MATLCELSAKAAREITNEARSRKLKEIKETICQDIYLTASQGKSYYFIDFRHYGVSCLEDWRYIYNWLKDLGYTVEITAAVN